MVNVVTNATVLILLAKVQRLSLLDIFQDVMTTPEVKREVLAGKVIPIEEKIALEKYFLDRIQVESAVKLLHLDLERGETSALSLALEKKATLFLSDDKKARQVAQALLFKPIGTIGVILRNVKERKLTREEARILVDLLVEKAYFISTDVYQNFLQVLQQPKHKL